ncbi:Ankyrin repeat-containing protein [Halopseudomonas litoralis]|uniref:Ankyrin repeat-containing protein n=1 Tax=Halopseudomonas litoralis TaxID=797277 RepID=A0A1H1REL1_9GAMM|nr:ankyrin repeat domain-containing protein [Halopseudomonas litoralis]SDS33986.1 Ankyrin repeat-containing protein [Halopseudomonas litoralis]
MPVKALSPFGLLVIAALLAGCAAPVPPKPPLDTTPKARQPLPSTKASFACGGALPAVHRQICAADALAQLDKDLVARQHRLQQELDLTGSLLLAANHRQWLLSRGELCGIDTDAEPDAQAQACLTAMYRQRSGELARWQPVEPTAGGTHALASYAEYRLMDNRAGAMCEQLGQKLNRDLRSKGMPSPARLPGIRLLAGSHAPAATASVDGQQVKVDLYNAGLYAGYQMRASGLSINGQPVMDDATLPRWVAEQPNYGGRAHASSSQTGDYGSIDVFRRGEGAYVLVNETWGFHSPAARGESAYAGLYGLNGATLQPLCLYQTYLTPPRTNTLAGLAAYSSLEVELDGIAGDPLPAMAQHERRDRFQAWKELQWTLLNLPLLGADSLARYGREAALRQRHDLALDALFDWSERNLTNKQVYRRVMPMLQPAWQELRQMFLGQGLNDVEATSAADLLLHETLARSMENLTPPAQPVSLPLPAHARYQSRFAVAPLAGDLERGRHFSTLHSVLMNNGPTHVVRDFIAYETGALGEQRGLGPDNSPATMAAVLRPDNLQLLLDAGFAADQANRWGKTALMAAAEQNQPESVRLLLARGADVHRRTRQLGDVGVGGPERRQAGQGRQTALLLASSGAGAEVIQLLLDAGAARQAWDGYDRDVCQRLKANAVLANADREQLRGPVCAAYAMLPAAERPPVDLRKGDVLQHQADGAEYRISLKQRPAAMLFSRPLESSPVDLDRQLRSLAIKIGTAAVRRGGMQLTGPLTLHVPDMAGNSASSLRMNVGFPVAANGGHVSGYALLNQPATTVLSVIFDSERNDAAGTWRALYEAAQAQNLTPANEGYIVLHTRGRRATEYQLVVTD